MSNDENKTQLIKLLLSEWRKPRYAARLRGRQLFFVCRENCICLTSSNGVLVGVRPEEDLFSSQEEADTRMILHCQHIAQHHPTSVIVVRSPDTDVLVLLLKFSQVINRTILFDTGIGNNRRLLNVNDIVSAKGSDICDVLPALHSFTGCDTTSAFVQRGKVTPLKVLEKRSQFIATFGALGQDIDIQATTFNELEHFVCCMYGKPKYSSINKLRYDLFMQKFRPKSGYVLSSFDGIDMSLLPPCQGSLYMHTQWANYQAWIWNSSLERHLEIPSPVGHGWVLDESDKLNYDWTKEDIMPQELADIICESRLGEDREVYDDNEDSDEEDGGSDEAETDNFEIDNLLMLCMKKATKVKIKRNTKRKTECVKN